jgi:hypothetical protein
MDEAHEDLANDGQSFFFRQLFPLLEEVLEVALVAELSDDVAIVGSAEDIVALEDVGVVELLECVYLALQHLFLGLALDGPDVDHFHCHLLFGLVVAAAVHHRTEPASDHVFQPVGIVFDLFAQLVMAIRVLCVYHSNSI